jgi:putative SOS response-associated peptidase YedK
LRAEIDDAKATASGPDGHQFGSVKEGETMNDLFGFLTTEPNAEVGTIRPKTMPVILKTKDDIEHWMNGEPPEALRLQRSCRMDR